MTKYVITHAHVYLPRRNERLYTISQNGEQRERVAALTQPVVLPEHF
ncbi:hypothetical protein [Anabaena sp. CCY 9402-a]